jgi:hypothetical protein
MNFRLKMVKSEVFGGGEITMSYIFKQFGGVFLKICFK